MTDAFCRAALLPRLSPRHSHVTKGVSHRDAPTPLLSAPKAPSAYESTESCSWLALRATLDSRHWYLGLAASTQLPTRVHPQAMQARPSHRAGYSPELLNHVTLVDFCNLSGPTSTTLNLQTPPFLSDSKLLPAGGDTSLRSVTSWAFAAQGSHCLRGTAIAVSASTDLGFTPTCWTQTPLCRSLTPPAIGKLSLVATGWMSRSL